MNLQERLVADMKEAMRSGEKARVELIRSTRAAIQNAQVEVAKQRYDEEVRAIEARHAGDADAREAALAGISVDSRTPIDDDAVLAVITKEIKRRRDAQELYQQAGRTDLAEKEAAEAALLEHYLPRQMSADELRPAVAAMIADLGLQGPADMGKLMPQLIERFKGRADGRLLSQIAREMLAQNT
jgi:uncharacterized protein YqeY